MLLLALSTASYYRCWIKSRARCLGEPFLVLWAELPTHIGGLVFLRPEEGSGFGFAAFAAFVRERLGAVDRFSWQLQEVPFGLDRP